MTPPASAPAQPRKPRLLAGQRELAQWTLQGGNSARAPWAWRMQLRWHAWWFERLSRQQASSLEQPRPRHAPVFVLGFWRSGTTLLHEWLSALPGHAAPATWQCFNPASFLLTGAPSAAAPGVQRPMDTGWIAPHSPQEDEFALLLQGAPSLYRGFIDPRRLADLACEVLEGEGAATHAPWVAPWLTFLAGVEQQASSRRLVLKSPNHVFRLPAIEQAFPGAPWVWIGRPAAEVWHSNLRMWRAMVDTYGLWPVPPGALEAFLDACMAHYTQVLERAVDAEPVSRVQWVEFDELYGDPQALLGRLTGRLPGPGGQGWDPGSWKTLPAPHPAKPAVTRTSEVPQGRAAVFAACDAAQRRARLAWGERRA